MILEHPYEPSRRPGGAEVYGLVGLSRHRVLPVTMVRHFHVGREHSREQTHLCTDRRPASRTHASLGDVRLEIKQRFVQLSLTIEGI